MGCRHKSKHKPRHHTHAIKTGARMMGLQLTPAKKTEAPAPTAAKAPTAAA